MFSKNKNEKLTSEIEIRMPTTETDDKRIQIFSFSVRKAERRKLDILLFAVCINMVLKNPPNMPILALKCFLVALH